MDGHGVLALVAPRACALAGWTDREGDLADEAAVRRRKACTLLDAPASLTLMCAPHCHPLARVGRMSTPPARRRCAPH